MSNCYDIEIKMNYFDCGDDYEDMLKKKKEFFDEAKDKDELNIIINAK